MKSISSTKLLIIFAVAFSLATVPGPLALSSSFLPHLPTVHAVGPAPNQQWFPAGPVTDTYTATIYTDEGSEFTGIQNHEIDVVDWPLDQTTAATLQASPDFVTTFPLSDTGWFELQFNMANNFGGCPFNFGNAACGQNIRQAFAHAVDKNAFIQIELGAGNGQPIDNAEPPVVALNSPNPCGWDQLFPQTGAGCQVNGAGGTAYLLPGHTTCGLGSCSSTPQFSYVAGLGTADFCAAADHLIAAGWATGASATVGTINGVPNLHLPGTGTCVLTGISPSVAANPIHIYIRSDNNPRLHVGEGYAQFICALLTGTFSTGCVSAGVTADLGPITAFCGFTTSPSNVNTCWWIYTAGFGLNTPTFDASLFFGVDSQFVSGVPGIKKPTPGAFCSAAAQGSFAAGNYFWICSPTYDARIEQAEFSPCLNAVGDPATGQTTPTFANCPSTSQLSAASAAYQAEDWYGQQVYTIPWYSGVNTFAYQNNGWNRMVLQQGSGFQANVDFFTLLNSYCTPSTASNPSFACSQNILRQGFKQSTGSVNPYIGNTVWDAGILGNVYDAPGAFNPHSPTAYLEWMTYRTDFIQPGSLGYTAPTGTIGAYRYNLRGDIFFHDGEQVSAWDLAFSYVTGRAAGLAFYPILGVKVLSKTQVDVLIGQIGPNTKIALDQTIVPGHTWTLTCPGSGTAAQNWHNALAANGNLNNCIAPSSSVTAAGVIIPDSSGSWHSNVDSNKLLPTYDNSTPANMNVIGSSAWECKSGGGAVGGDCSTSHNATPSVGQTWTLSRYGQGKCTGVLCTTSGFPGPSATYFRSNANLALYVWTNNNGRQDSSDFNNLAIVDGPQCYNKPVPTAGCTRWQHGIGNPSGVPIGQNQVSAVVRFYQLNWTAPYDWVNAPADNIAQPFSYNSATNGIVLYEGTQVLKPCSQDAVNGYDC